MLEGLHIRVVDEFQRVSKDGRSHSSHAQRVYVVDRNGEPVGELSYVHKASLTAQTNEAFPILRVEILVGPDSLSEFVIAREYVDEPTDAARD